MTNVLYTASRTQPATDIDWTAQTLQRIVHIGSLMEGRTLLNDLSSTAMYNLLVLLQSNIRILSKETLEQFIVNVEQLSFVSNDDWCRFLIKRLRSHLHGTHGQQALVAFKDSAVTTPSPLVTHEASEANVSTQSNDDEVMEESCERATVSEANVKLVSSPADLKLPSPPPPFNDGTYVVSI